MTTGKAVAIIQTARPKAISIPNHLEKKNIMRFARFLSLFALLVVLSVALIGCQPASTDVATTKPSPTVEAVATPTVAASSTPGEMKTSPSGFQYQDTQIGVGPRPLMGQNVKVAYVGKFLDGHKFDGGATDFTIGETGIIKGWNWGIGGNSKEGIDAMRVGGKRKIIVPPQLAYGDQPHSTIPPNSTLVFELELLRINRKAF